MKPIAILIAVLSLVFSQPLRARTQVVSTPSQTTTAPSGSSVNNTAKKSSSTASQMIVANASAGAAFYAASAGCTKAWLCVLGAAAVAQGFIFGGGKSNANAIDNATLGSPTGGMSLGGFDNTDSTSGSSSGFGPGENGVYSQLKDLEQKFGDAGYVVSPDGSSMTLPDGRTVSTDALASGSVPGFNVDDATREQANQIMDEAMKKASGARVVAVGTQDGGGGGGSGGSQGLALSDDGGGSRFDMSKYLKGLTKRDPSAVNGMSKKLGEDNIGIKSDNIFEMVSRQYKRKQSQSAFLK